MDDGDGDASRLDGEGRGHRAQTKRQSFRLGKGRWRWLISKLHFFSTPAGGCFYYIVFQMHCNVEQKALCMEPR